MIAMSKLVYNESAAGGFARKPIEIPKREQTVKSPDRGAPSKIDNKRDIPPGTIKKGVVNKLNSLPNAASSSYYDNVGPIATSIQHSNTVQMNNSQGIVSAVTQTKQKAVTLKDRNNTHGHTF